MQFSLDLLLQVLRVSYENNSPSSNSAKQSKYDCLFLGGAKLILHLSSPTDRPRCPREAHPRSGAADRPTLPRAARRSAVGPGVPDRPTLPRVARRGAWVSRGGLALCTVLMAAVPRMQSSPSSLWVVVGHIIVSVWSQRRPCAAPLARGAFPPAPRGRGAVIDLTHRLSQR